MMMKGRGGDKRDVECGAERRFEGGWGWVKGVSEGNAHVEGSFF